MFSVYGTAGQIFRGSLEELGKVAGIRRAARTRRIEALGLDAQDHSPLRFADVLNQGGPGFFANGLRVFKACLPVVASHAHLDQAMRVQVHVDFFDHIGC